MTAARRPRDAQPESAGARRVVIATVLALLSDALVLAILTFTLAAVARAFGIKFSSIAFVIFLTLIARVIGAQVFGRLADNLGRRRLLIVSILAVSLCQLLAGLAPDFAIYAILCTIIGFAMGGEWGIGTALAMESIPVHWRGRVSGLLQAAYPLGLLLGSLLVAFVTPFIGWRWTFVIGAIPALLVLYIRASVPESPVWQTMARKARVPVASVLKQYRALTVYAIILMTALGFLMTCGLNLFAGPLLIANHHFSIMMISVMVMISSAGAIIGSIVFGTLSQTIGRRRAIGVAAGLTLPLVLLWNGTSNQIVLGLGAFLMQFCIQGAWGVIPAYLSELSPREVRATLPGFAFQLSRVLATAGGPIAIMVDLQNFDDYGQAVSWIIGFTAVLIIILMFYGPERKDSAMGESRAAYQLAHSGVRNPAPVTYSSARPDRAPDRIQPRGKKPTRTTTTKRPDHL